MSSLSQRFIFSRWTNSVGAYSGFPRQPSFEIFVSTRESTEKPLLTRAISSITSGPAICASRIEAGLLMIRSAPNRRWSLKIASSRYFRSRSSSSSPYCCATPSCSVAKRCSLNLHRMKALNNWLVIFIAKATRVATVRIDFFLN